MTDLRIAVPPGWDSTQPSDGPVVLLATGPVDPATGHAPTLVCSADGTAEFDVLLRRSLASLADPRVVAVEPVDDGTIALVSHDVAGTGSTLLLRHVPASGLVLTGTAPDLAWPVLGPVIETAVRTADT